MERKLSVRTTIFSAILTLLLFLPCSAQTAKERVSTNISRLEKTLSSLKMPEQDAKFMTDILLSSKSASQSGYLYLSLFRLQLVNTMIQSEDYKESKQNIEKEGVEAFEREWKRVGGEMDEKERLLSSKVSNPRPASIRALIESSIIQSRPYYQSGHLYGLNTTIGYGLLYMSNGPVLLDFALFCQELPFEDIKTQLKFRSVESELNQLESEVLQAFNQPDATNQLLQFDRLNATLKVAQELNRDKKYTGALQKLLEARYYLGLINNSSPSVEELARLKEQSSQFEKRLKNSDADQSIGIFFWEIGQFAIDRASMDKSNPDELKKASVIFNSVLPAYFKFCCGEK